jgi:exonuclease III
MCRRSREVVEMIARRRLDFCCLQETRWKGGSAKIIGSEGYKFFWMGCKEGTAGIGVVIAKRWVDKVIEVKRVSERVMVVRVAVGKSVLNLISVYAPQVGRSMEEKEEFWTLLGSVIGGINARESLVLCGT